MVSPDRKVGVQNQVDFKRSEGPTHSHQQWRGNGPPLRVHSAIPRSAPSPCLRVSPPQALGPEKAGRRISTRFRPW
jgi:hypothetical protein